MSDREAWNALKGLAGLPDDQIIPNPYDGEDTTVGAVRAHFTRLGEVRTPDASDAMAYGIYAMEPAAGTPGTPGLSLDMIDRVLMRAMRQPGQIRPQPNEAGRMVYGSPTLSIGDADAASLRERYGVQRMSSRNWQVRANTDRAIMRGEQTNENGKTRQGDQIIEPKPPIRFSELDRIARENPPHHGINTLSVPIQSPIRGYAVGCENSIRLTPMQSYELRRAEHHGRLFWKYTGEVIMDNPTIHETMEENVRLKRAIRDLEAQVADLRANYSTDNSPALGGARLKTFDDLVTRCKGSVAIEANPHRDCYDTIEQYLRLRDETPSPEELARLLAAPDLYELQFYPETPVGFVYMLGTSSEELVSRAHAYLDGNQ